MTSVGRDLVQRLRGETLEKNPLLIIGISQAILDLNLSEDEIYAICQRHASYALSRAHPDSHQGNTTKGTLELTEALNMLRDRTIFRRALAELREMHAFTSSNERTLRYQLDRSNRENADLQTQLQTQKARHAQEARFHEWAERYLVRHAVRFSSRKATDRPVADCTQLKAATITLSVSAPPSASKETAAELANFYKHAKQRADREYKGFLTSRDRAYLQTAIETNHLHAKPLSALITQALTEANMPSVHWNFARAAHELGFPKLAQGLARIDRGRVARETRMEEEWTPSVITEYRNSLERLSRAFPNLHVSRLNITPKRLEVHNQIVAEGPKTGSLRLNILGTVDWETGLAYAKPALGNWIALQDEVLLQVEPFLRRGRAVVSLEAPNPLFTKTWDSPAGGIDRIKRPNPLYLSHIVIDVE